MLKISILQALLISAYVGWAHAYVGYTFGCEPLNSALVTSLVVGIILGKVPEAVTIGAAIQLLYMGIVEVGGTVVQDPNVAAAVAIPVALASGLTPEQAVTVAVPVGLLAAFLTNVKYFINSLFVHAADRYATEENTKMIAIYATIIPILVTIILYIIPTFIAIYSGSAAINNIIHFIPQSVMHALEVIGGALPALGFALAIFVIGRQDLLLFFVGAFFIPVSLSVLKLNVPENMTILFAIFGSAIAYLYVMLKSKDNPQEKEGAATSDSGTLDTSAKVLSDKDLRSTWNRWWWWAETSHSYERLQSLAFCNALAPNLKKLYKGGEELKKALTRHLEFFNTEGIWGGGPILGITLSMEESRAKALESGKEALDPGVISATKFGLMGSLAGIGDSIDWATLFYILIGILLPWAKAGLWISPVLFVAIFATTTYLIGYYLFMQSYRLGRISVTQWLQSGLIRKIQEGLSVLGMFMMGILSSTYVNISSSLKWTISGQTFALQDILDGILPGLLPFATIMLLYSFFSKKGLKIVQAALFLIVVFGILGLIGVL